MRRFRRVHGVEALVREMPLALHFFDCLIAEGRSLIDAPYAERWEALTRRDRRDAIWPSAPSSTTTPPRRRFTRGRWPRGTRA